MNQILKTFPQSYNTISTIGLQVKVDYLDSKSNVISSVRCILEENTTLVSSDLNMSFFISGKYNITILDTLGNPYTALSDLFIVGYTLFNPLIVNSTDQIIDVISYDGIIATNSDSIIHNLNNTNVMVQLVSMDSATMNQQLITVDSNNPITVTLLPSSITVNNVSANGYTKYKVSIFNRANNVNQP